MKRPTKVYVVMLLQPWSAISVGQWRGDDRPIGAVTGFMPVFTNKREATKFAGGRKDLVKEARCSLAEEVTHG